MTYTQVFTIWSEHKLRSLMDWRQLQWHFFLPEDRLILKHLQDGPHSSQTGTNWAVFKCLWTWGSEYIQQVTLEVSLSRLLISPAQLSRDLGTTQYLPSLGRNCITCAPTGLGDGKGAQDDTGKKIHLREKQELVKWQKLWPSQLIAGLRSRGSSLCVGGRIPLVRHVTHSHSNSVPALGSLCPPRILSSKDRQSRHTFSSPSPQHFPASTACRPLCSTAATGAADAPWLGWA